jgi:hypothetical protein
VTKSQVDEMRDCIKNSDHDYIRAQQSIRDKWRCDECGTAKFCFLQPHPDPMRENVHVNLSPNFIAQWAGEIKDGNATVRQPPRDILEINKACNAAILRPQGRGRVDDSSKTSRHDYAPAPVINYHFQPPSPSDYGSGSSRPRTPPPVERHHHASPIPGYTSKDYAEDALKAYMMYLQENWGNARTTYLELYGALQLKDVGVDQLTGMEETLRKEFDCTIGMASRIVSEYTVWKKSLKGVRSTYILILQC